MAKKKPTETKPTAPPQVAPKAVYVPKTPVTEAELKRLYTEVEDHWIEQAEHYGYGNGDLKDRPDNVVARMQAILGAVDKETALTATKRAKECIQVMILGAWARGKIEGPVSRQSLAKQIKSAESLAAMLEGKGQQDAAVRQRARADRLREQLQEFSSKE